MSNPTTTNLEQHYKADALSLTDGDPVSTWPDETANGLDLAAGGTNDAIYRDSVQNSLPGVEFAKAGEAYLENDRGNQAQPKTIHVAVRRDDDTNSNGYVIQAMSSLAELAARVGVTNAQDEFWLEAGANLRSGSEGSVGMHILTYVVDGASSVIRLNGTQIASGDAGSDNLRMLRVGTSGSGDGLGGYIFEMMVYDGALSSTDIDHNETYLTDKWVASAQTESDGSFATVEVDAISGSAVVNGSFATVEVDAISGASTDREGGSFATVEVDATSGASLDHKGGSFATVAVVPFGGGTPEARNRPGLIAYDEKNQTQLGDVINLKGLRWIDDLNDQGSGKVQVPVDIDTSLIAEGNVLRPTFDGKHVFAFIIDEGQTVVVDDEGNRWITLSGDGLLQWTDDIAIYPEFGLRRDSPDERPFGYMSQDVSKIVPDISTWKTPHKIDRQGSEDSYKYPYPMEWPDPLATWVWGTEPVPNETTQNSVEAGINYFRHTFTLATSREAVMFVTADEYVTVWVDGRRMLETKEFFGWQETNQIALDLESGEHVLAFEVETVKRGGFNSSAGLLVSIAEAHAVDTWGQEMEEWDGTGTQPTIPDADIIVRTGDGGWRVLPYPDNPPGWTAGSILLKLLEESKDRGDAAGVETPAHVLDPRFTDEADSNGDPWARPINIRAHVFRDTMRDVVARLAESALNPWVTPNNQLHAVAKRETDVADTVTLLEENILGGVTDKRRRIQANSLLVRYEGGFLERTVGVNGGLRREKPLLLGDTSSNEQAVAESDYALDQVGKNSSLVTVPLASGVGDQPYRQFSVGYWVTLSTTLRGTEKLRVRSITGQVNNDGNLEWEVQLGTIRFDKAPQQAQTDWIRRMTGGTLGGRIRSAAPVTRPDPTVTTPSFEADESETTEPMFHFQADSLSLADGAEVTSWVNDGTGPDLASGGPEGDDNRYPLYEENVLNGLPGVNLSRVETDFSFLSRTSSGLIATQAISSGYATSLWVVSVRPTEASSRGEFAIFQVGAVDASDFRALLQGGYADWQSGDSHDGPADHYLRAATGDDADSSTVDVMLAASPPDALQVEASRDPSVIELEAQSTSHTKASMDTTYLWLPIGAHCHLHELIIWPEAVSQSVVDSWKSTLSTKWGV